MSSRQHAHNETGNWGNINIMSRRTFCLWTSDRSVDSIYRGHMLKILKSKEIPSKLIRSIRMTLKSSQAKVTIESN
jgi:hypothetical protein